MKNNKVSRHHMVKAFGEDGTVYTQRVLMTREEFNFFKSEIKSIPDMAIRSLRSYLTLATRRKLAEHKDFLYELQYENTYIQIV